MKAFPLGWLTVAAISMLTATAAWAQETQFSLSQFKKEYQTKLLRQDKIGQPAPEPPAGVFDKVSYEAPLGKMAAYVSPDPKDGKKHPLIIWRVGGFANSIGSTAWEEPEQKDNDQSASQYRKAGVLMMYPSLRGGNGNPGFLEGCYGEVEDVLAAAEYAKKLPYVDPDQIYLGGHSVGGTLALLAAAMDGNPFKAIISFGPIHSTAHYGPDNVPFDVENRMEMVGRAPIVFLNTIKTETWVIEGSDGNIDALHALQKYNKNPKVHLVEVPGGHFNILAPLNQLVAKRILAASKDGTFVLEEKDLKALTQ